MELVCIIFYSLSSRQIATDQWSIVFSFDDCSHYIGSNPYCNQQGIYICFPEKQVYVWHLL